jgi:hypothetical protein
LEILPVSFQVVYSLKSLPADLLDVIGDPIRNGIDYVAVVLVFGAGNQQLSKFSGSFSLRDKHIYSGRYFYGYSKSCTMLLDGASLPLNASADGTFFIELSESGDLLVGVLKCTNCPNKLAGGVEFAFDKTNITYYRLIDLIWPCDPPQYCVGVTECSYYEFVVGDGHGVGIGSILDDLVIEMDITSDDCISECEGKVQFVRQG